MTGALLALLGAIAIGCGSARQHAVASGEAVEAAVNPRLILTLARRKDWLIGVVMASCGFALVASAIATGRLVVVEPIGSTQVLFGLLYAARATRTPLRRSEWIAIGATICGLAGFLIVAAPKAADDPSPIVPWAVPLGILAAALVVGALATRAMSPSRRGVTYAVLAGLTFGVADSLIKAISEHGLDGILTHWSLYAWMAVGPIGFLLQQSSYNATHLGAAMPVTTTLTPTLATVLGAAMFGEQLRGGWAIPVEIAFFALLLVGVASLARSKTLEGDAATLEAIPGA